MVKIGVGEDQNRSYKKADRKIMEVLSDGKAHQYSEVFGKSKLSTATISKHLKRLEAKGEVTREVLQKDWRTVYYKLTDQGKYEKFRKSAISRTENMPIDLALEYDGPFYLPLELPIESEHPLNRLRRTDEIFPSATFKYSLFFKIGRKSDENAKRILGLEHSLRIHKLVSDILCSVVVLVDRKDPRFIEEGNVDQLVDWYKDALDQKVILNVKFDGKAVAETVDWNKVKKKAKQAFEKQKEKKKMMEEDKQKLIEAWRKFYPDSKELNEEQKKFIHQQTLEEMISFAISYQNHIFLKKVDGVKAVIDTIKDKRIMKEQFNYPIIIPLEGIDLKRAIRDYLNDPESEYVWTMEKYRYPETEKWHDIFRFMDREVAEFMSKDPNKRLKIVAA